MLTKSSSWQIVYVTLNTINGVVLDIAYLLDKISFLSVGLFNWHWPFWPPVSQTKQNKTKKLTRWNQLNGGQ